MTMITPQELTEGNKLIAEFMGWKKKSGFEYLWVKSHQKENGIVEDQLKFHSSWDWLMPVVEKIEKMEHKTIIGGGDYWGNYCNIMYGVSLKETDDTKAMGQGDSKIEAVYKAVVQFIQWYTQLKPGVSPE